ncbi:MAG: hypothetical protein GY854_13470 [Deltaproteobacteria bacterium]|nr:hypothetical protein [Deltaproteobacteria bacterium]
MRILDIATRAINEQYHKLSDSAARVAKLNSPTEEGAEPVDLVKETATRIEADAAVRANLAVMKEEDERLKHLLDIMA